MPHYPAAWSSDMWKPIGGCSFTGGAVGITGNSALRFCLLTCLLTQWHSLAVRPSMLFPEDPCQGVDDMVSVHTPSETGSELCARQLTQAANDQGSSESGSSTPEHPVSPLHGHPTHKLGFPAFLCLGAPSHKSCASKRFIESACHRSLSKVLKGRPQKVSSLSQSVISKVSLKVALKGMRSILKGVQNRKGLKRLLTQLQMTH